MVINGLLSPGIFAKRGDTCSNKFSVTGELVWVDLVVAHFGFAQYFELCRAPVWFENRKPFSRFLNYIVGTDKL